MIWAWIASAPLKVVRVEVKPTGASGYSKVLMWIRPKDFIPLRVQMFGKDGQLVKTTFTRRIKDIDGRAVIVESHTESAKNNHKTDLILDEVVFKPDLSDALFTLGLGL